MTKMDCGIVDVGLAQGMATTIIVQVDVDHLSEKRYVDVEN